MLRNEPPAGTKIRFTSLARKVAARETATLVRPLQKYLVDRPEDQFVVRYRGEEITVSRDEIERAEVETA